MHCSFFQWALILVLFGCTSMKAHPNKTENLDLYSKEFLAKMDSIKKSHQEGQGERALASLNAIPDDKLGQLEKVMKHNLQGVISFSLKKYTQAMEEFQLALKGPDTDDGLYEQVKFNLASCYFMTGDFEKSYQGLKSIRPDWLPEKEEKKFHQLSFVIGQKVADKIFALKGLAHFLGDYKNLNDLRKDIFLDKLLKNFQLLTADEKKDFLQRPHSASRLLPLGFLYLQQVQESLSPGQEERREFFAEKIEDDFSQFKDLQAELASLLQGLKQSQKFFPTHVGVILPLTGEKQGFGKRALMGLDSAQKYSALLPTTPTSLQQQNRENSPPPVLFFKDSEGSPVVGERRVKELVDEHKVSVVIGGLFSDEAEREYLAARDLGVLFISLAPIYLSTQQKSSLLIEIPGPLESQFETLLGEKNLQLLGKKVALIYPQNELGQNHAQLFWDLAQKKGAIITRIQSYPKSTVDYRGVVQSILGLKYKRERKEEGELWKAIYSLDKSKMRRVQDMPPQIDFDWVFVAATPTGAEQILPIFSYYDAFGLKYVGPPSWKTERLAQFSKKEAQVYILDTPLTEDRETQEKNFNSFFIENFKSPPKVVELVANEAMTLFLNMKDEILKMDERQDFARWFSQSPSIKGRTGKWALEGAHWKKELSLLQLKQDGLMNVPSPQNQ